MIQYSPSDLVSERLPVSLDIVVPTVLSATNLELWAEVLTGEKCWLAPKRYPTVFEDLESHERLFIFCFLRLSQTLFQLGRIPIFEDPIIVSIHRKEKTENRYVLQLSMPLIRLFPNEAYQRPLKTAIELCKWVVQKTPTPANRNRVFTIIDQRVITPLYRLTKGGKSTIPVLRVAHSLGIPFIHLGLGVYQIGWGSKARRLDRSTTQFDSAIGARLTHDKVSTADILRLTGLPAPVHQVVQTHSGAAAAAAQIGFPVVVKPSDRERGEGVTVDVIDDDTLSTAFSSAQNISRSRQVIIERQVLGVCHRLLILGDRLLYAVKRLPISVLGDGSRTVRQLVEDEVAVQDRTPPWLRSAIKPIDSLALSALEKAGFSLDSIPEDGVIVPLRRIETTEWGGVDEDVTAIIHPANLSVAIEAAKLFGLYVAGVDIISPDISLPWYKNGAIINEVNFAPLLGGAAISKSYIPSFFAEFIQGDGKIPIEFFESRETALKRQAEYSKQKLRCFFINPEETLDSWGNPVPLPFTSVKDKAKALICRTNVDAVVISG